MNTSGKLGIAAFVIAGVTAYMAYIGSASGWTYFLTVEECLSRAPALVNQPIRVSGKIVSGSLQIAPSRDRATFRIGQASDELPVSCTGTLPDNLREGSEVVVEGTLDDSGTLCGTKVLTRCASKYASESNEACNAPSCEVPSTPPMEEHRE